ncbi:hypothetical protein LUZ63_015815 [Rhynchospora breviuscula]|uniref:Protein kinase domain-containing protein n=1 Tax=Rhynchospora breviuscula TaxID=2022672 RepID=A0A9Q0CD43_9POAL|nr:hypothetical protein LUZ63_015815 [Rhynchospora breviuscula]
MNLIPATVGIVEILLILAAILFHKATQRSQLNSTTRNRSNGDARLVAGAGSVTIIQYRLRDLEKATDYFSDGNRIGKGGFGEVYKGRIDGEIVAIKLLYGSSVKLLEDIGKEVSLLSSLNNNNLVKLLGFCSEAGRYLLVYEYISNGDLRGCLVDDKKRETLNWDKRFKIIEGIAGGLSYLHHNSKNVVIHRDLKPENILLDKQYTPKIADFGLSRVFDSGKTHKSTRKIAGTLGYFAPELWFQWQYSTSSDVYSYGLLVLEILAGCTIPRYAQANQETLSHSMWKQWKDKKPLAEFIDPFLYKNCSMDQVSRCYVIGLLCVQHDPKRRPRLEHVLQMLHSNNIDLPTPSFPGFLQETEPRQTSLSENKHQSPETMAPKEVQKLKGVTVKRTAAKNSGPSKTAGVNIVGRVSNAGFGKAVEGLDLIVSGMAKLNPSTWFSSGSTAKGAAISILAFEVENAIMKGANLMHSLSKENVRYLNEVVFVSNGVQRLISSNTSELEQLVAADKRHELNVFAKEVVRFGDRCKDPQWHNMDRYFSYLFSEIMPQKQLKEIAMAEMQYLLNLVKNTEELYHEISSLNKFEQDFRQRYKDASPAEYERDTMQIIKQELKSQRKHVKRLKKKSLWSKMFEDVIGKLVDLVHFLHLEIGRVFDVPDGNLENGSTNNRQSLGPAGLALHYANIITHIDAIVSRPSSVPSNTRDALYQGLPPSMKSDLKKGLQTTPLVPEVQVSQLRTSIDSSLQWLVPIATNTTEAHHGFGRFTEWANTGGEVYRKQNNPMRTEVTKIETLYHADKAKTEAYILDLLIWLHYLISQTSPLNGGRLVAIVKYANSNRENQEKVCQLASNLIKYRGLIESKEFERNCILKLKRNDRLSKSSGHWPPPVVVFETERIRVLDKLDGVDFC